MVKVLETSTRELGTSGHALLSCLALHVPQPLSASSKGNPDAGKKIYLQSCQSCHSPTGKADSNLATHLTLPPANLAAKATQTKTG